MTTSSPTYRGWQKLPDNALGHAVFSAAMSIRVCEVRSPKWWGVHNHLGTFHAIAACNLAEVAMGMLSEATVPNSHRWIPKSMKVDYLAKAETGLRAVARLETLPDFAAIESGTELLVPISIFDRGGKEVVHAEITTWVSPK
jgi:acyl-coenzyme A thioesterase PaaI-like protein